jgi:hypothetical protein
LAGEKKTFFNILKGRVTLLSFMFLSFYFLSPIVGIDKAFLILLPPFMFVTIIAYLQMGLKNIASKRSFLFSALFAILFLGIVLLFPPNKMGEWYTIVIRQGLIEELYFRFCALGILKTCDEWSRLGVVRKALFMVTNALLFALLHIQYQTFSEYLTIFLISVIFAYLFIENGIVPAIVAHSLWNFYLNLYSFIPLLALSMIEKLTKKRHT